MKVLLIYRAARFSPNSVDKDMRILEAVGDELWNDGHEVTYVSEENISENDDADVILSMGRLPETVAWIARKEAQGRLVMNGSRGMKNSQRSAIERLMRDNNISSAPLEGDKGYWIKRGDGAAQEKNDVMFAPDEAERDRIINEMKGRGIADVVVTAHVEGDVLKFYGVEGTDFFRCFYPSDDGESKFGDEKMNGIARHFAFDRGQLAADASRLARLSGLDIYGGDCIIRSDGTFAIIDFNDWPSYSRCRDEAARAIVDSIKKRV